MAGKAIEGLLELTWNPVFVTLKTRLACSGHSVERTSAVVAELADAHGSGPCTRKGVGVRVPPSAPKFSDISL